MENTHTSAPAGNTALCKAFRNIFGTITLILGAIDFVIVMSSDDKGGKPQALLIIGVTVAFSISYLLTKNRANKLKRLQTN